MIKRIAMIQIALSFAAAQGYANPFDGLAAFAEKTTGQSADAPSSAKYCEFQQSKELPGSKSGSEKSVSSTKAN